MTDETKKPEFDYSEYSEEKPADKLESLSKFVDQLSESNLLVASIEKQLEDAKREQKRVADECILPLMDELKLEEYKTQYGFYIAARTEIRASIPTANQPLAYNWLRGSGNGSLIKNELKIEFGRAKDNEAKALAAELSEKGYDVENKETVHWSTLNSFIKEKSEKGEYIDPSITVFRQRILVTEEKAKSRKAG